MRLEDHYDVVGFHNRSAGQPRRARRGRGALRDAGSAAMRTIVAATPLAAADLVTEPEQIDAMVEDLRSGAAALAALSAGERAQLARQCLAGVASLGERWSAVGAACKSMPPDDAFAIEELVLGP